MNEAVRTAPEAVDLEKYPGLRVLREVTGYLEAGIGTDEVFQGIIAAVERGVGARDCRIWVRTPDGSAFRAFVAAGGDEPGSEDADRVSRQVKEGESQERVGDRRQVRIPLSHAGEHLGLLEASLPESSRSSWNASWRRACPRSSPTPSSCFRYSWTS